MFEAALLLVLMAAFLFYDPFRLAYKITDFLRLKFPVFVKEPKLLFYAYIYMGSLIAKTVSIIMIMALLTAKRADMSEALALKSPRLKKFGLYASAFIIFSLCTRLYISQNPMAPNLPIRLIFPDAMLISNIAMPI